MDKIILEITNTNRHLCVERGFVLVKEHDKLLGKVPLDSVSVVMANSYGMTVSNNLLVALSERNIPFISCGKNHVPAAVLWSTEGNYRQAFCSDAQAKAGEVLNKNLWKTIVKQKIRNQRFVAESVGSNSLRLKELESSVKSGDTRNNEAQAAKIYFNLVFGNDFIRDRNAEGINSLLNYGYTILRSLTSRAVMSAGLNPVFSIYHKNKLNPMRLVDDVMEPFRPVVDQTVLCIISNTIPEVNKTTKKILAGLHLLPMKKEGLNSTVGFCIQDLAVSLAKVYMKELDTLSLPDGIVDRVYIEEHIKECMLV